MNTVSDVRFAISQKFREIEGCIDILQKELGTKAKEIEDLKTKQMEEEKKD